MAWRESWGARREDWGRLRPAESRLAYCCAFCERLAAGRETLSEGSARDVPPRPFPGQLRTLLSEVSMARGGGREVEEWGGGKAGDRRRGLTALTLNSALGCYPAL